MREDQTPFRTGSRNMQDSHSLRQLGTSDLWVSTVGMGCWPIAGVSSLDVTELGCTVSQLVIAWTIQQPGITVALCGAKRPEQIEETALAMAVQLDEAVINQIGCWLLEVASL